MKAGDRVKWLPPCSINGTVKAIDGDGPVLVAWDAPEGEPGEEYESVVSLSELEPETT